MQVRLLCAIAALALAPGACTGSGPAPERVSPGEIPRLEQRVARDSNDADAAFRLGLAYAEAGRTEQSLETLRRAVRLPGAPAEAWARLGAVADEARRDTLAETAYREYLDRGGAAERDEVAARLELVRRRLLVADARRALEREEELTGRTPDGGLVAVLPFAVDGDEEYRVLGRGFADLLTTDLGLTDRLRVLERVRVQALLDEMNLNLAGYVSPSTAARTGRLLAAGRIVRGRITIPEESEERSASIRAVLLDAARPDDAADADARGELRALMELEVRVALSLYRELGIELTDAEIARIRERPTDDLQAFLAYSRGLVALDRGDFRGALRWFREAVRLDPGFDAAASAAEAAARLAAADGQEPPASIPTGASSERSAARRILADLTDAAVPAGAGSATSTVGAALPDGVSTADPILPRDRNATQATAGTHRQTRSQRVKIEIVRPAPSSSPPE